LKGQTCVARSSTEAEIYALAEGVAQLSVIFKMLYGLFTDKLVFKGKIYSDNVNALKTKKQGYLSNINRHVQLNLEFIKDEVGHLKSETIHVSSDLNPSDLLTKAIKGKKLLDLKEIMGMSSYDENKAVGGKVDDL
jgi:uncharacterized membrane-anchored protein